MEELFDLDGHYNLNLSFEEDQRTIYATTNSATSMLSRDIEKLKNIVGAEKAEIYGDQEENFLIQLPIPEDNNQ